jgi:hypothetical protein
MTAEHMQKNHQLFLNSCSTFGEYINRLVVDPIVWGGEHEINVLNVNKRNIRNTG